MVAVLLLVLRGVGVLGMKLNRPWTSQHWCESVVQPHWPFAYSKGELVETKGRVVRMLHRPKIPSIYYRCYLRSATSIVR